MEQKFILNRLILITGALLVVLSMPVHAQLKAPQLKLFPSDVTAMLKETGETAKAMENSLKGVIGRFDEQTQRFNDKGCTPDSNEQACESMKEQISNTYQELLGIMQENLPKMKKNIEATSKSLGIRMHQQLGKRMTPSEIQKTLGEESLPDVTTGRFSLSKRFKEYYNLISSNQQQSLSVLAAEIYLDTSSVSEWIDLMEAEIGRQRTFLELGRMYGSITSKMFDTVDNVKNIIFGEEQGMSGTSQMPQKPEEPTEYKSHRELDW
jgi:hypothetical protein